ASTAVLTCSKVHIGVSAITSPVEGLCTAVVATPSTSRHSPPHQTGQGSSLVFFPISKVAVLIFIQMKPASAGWSLRKFQTMLQITGSSFHKQLRDGAFSTDAPESVSFRRAR